MKLEVEQSQRHHPKVHRREGFLRPPVGLREFTNSRSTELLAPWLDEEQSLARKRT